MVTQLQEGFLGVVVKLVLLEEAGTDGQVLLVLVLVHLSAQLRQPLVVLHLGEDGHSLLVVAGPDVQLDGLLGVVVLNEPLGLLALDVCQVHLLLGGVVASDLDYSLGIVESPEVHVQLCCLIGCCRFNVQVSCFLVLPLVRKNLSLEEGIIELTLHLVFSVLSGQLDEGEILELNKTLLQDLSTFSAMANSPF